MELGTNYNASQNESHLRIFSICDVHQLHVNIRNKNIRLYCDEIKTNAMWYLKKSLCTHMSYFSGLP